MKQLRKVCLCAILCLSMTALAGCGRDGETERMTEKETASPMEAGGEENKNMNSASTSEKAPAETGVLKEAGDDLKNGAKDMGDGIKDGVEDVGEGIKDGAKDIKDDLKEDTDRTKDNKQTEKK